MSLPLAACWNQEAGNPRFNVAAPPVEAVQARFGSLPLVERLSGTVWAENQVSLLPEISGRIAEVLVDNGARVAQGAPIARLRDEQYSEQVRRAEAGLRISEARLRQAESRLVEVDNQGQRTRTLGERNLVTQAELETVAAQVESARADVALAEAQLEQAAATLAEQRDLLDKTIIRAPIAGIVGDRRAEVGMQVTPNTALFTIGNLDRLKIRFSVTDHMLSNIKVGQTARISLGKTGDQATTIVARVSRISPFLNEITRSADAEVEIDNPGARLHPGMFVPVDIAYGESQQATLIPVSALFVEPNTGREGIFLVGGKMPSSLDDPEFVPEELPAGASPAVKNAGDRDTLTLAEPRPVVFRSISAIARGEHEVAVSGLESGTWVVSLGQDLLSSGRNSATVRAVSWGHVMMLQGLKREDLLEEILKPVALDLEEL